MKDRKDSMAILRVHLRKIPIARGVDLDRIAARTPDFTDADFKNLVNEAAILAARDNEEQVRVKHFDKAPTRQDALARESSPRNATAWR
ncbi:MAG: hypothetical protein P3W87_005190 [Gammaproteobacteria bacterium]|nr:hypothetical protein [Gammaproteobacteria bacterium]